MAGASSRLGQARAGFTRLASPSSSAPTFDYSVSASTSLALGAAATESVGHSYAVSASSPLVLHATAGRVFPNPRPVSAATSLVLHATGSEVVTIERPVAATGRVLLQDRALASVGRPRIVSAASSLVLHALGRDPDNPDVAVSAGSTLVLASASTPQQDRAVSAGVSLGLAAVGSARVPHAWPVSARAGFVLGPRARGTVPGSPAVQAATSITFGPSATAHNTSILAGAASGLALAGRADAVDPGPRAVFAASGLALGASATGRVAALRPVAATTAIGLSARAAANGEHGVHAASTVALAAVARQGREIHVAATTGLGLGLAEHVAPLIPEEALVHVAFADAATATLDALGAVIRLAFRDAAAARVTLPAGAGAPGAPAPRSFGRVAALSIAPPPSQGLRTVLRSDVSGDFPNSYAETPSGLVLIANGVDPMLRWDGLSGTAVPAGLVPPGRPVLLGGIGAGTIVGERVAYQRFLDRDGNPSILSPVSNTVEFGTDGLIDSIVHGPDGRVTVTSGAHGLTTGDPVVISGVTGLGAVNGIWPVTVTGPDTFALDGVVATSGASAGGGSWTLGVAQVAYSGVEAPADPKVVRRQLLRNLAGNGEVFYVDIDTTDLVATTFFSALDDEALSAREPVPLLFDDDLPQANRYYPPPASKAVVAAHMGRIFATADVTVDRGMVRASFGSATVAGLATDWRPSLVGRTLYIAGASRGYEIAAVDRAAQTLTLVGPLADSVPVPASYAIRAPLGERKFVFYSEPNLPEAWPPWNAIAVPEDGDGICGLMVKDSFLYILEQRHIYKYTLQSDPATDGFLFLAARRGAVNNRCVAQVEGAAYMLDDVGIHRFDGGESEAISMPIQPIFQRGVGLGGVEVNWAADRSLWHASLDPVRETIRWFVSMTGTSQPRHAICHDFRRGRWWIEEYPSPMLSSVVATIDSRRALVGTDGGRVLCLSEGTLDAADPSVGGLGAVTSAGPLSLVDAAGRFPADLAGAPVSIARGKGSGQQRRIVASTATRLEIDRPWRVRPDATSSYQVGGVHWRWDSGWSRYVEDEYENPRDVELIFQPTRLAASMDVELFYDHATAPRAWAYTAADDGVATLAGSSRIAIDLARPTGYAIQRMAGHRASYAEGDRFVSARLSGVQGPDPVRIYQLTLNGAR